MRIIANFHKGEALRFLSHLDIQRLVQRAMRRAQLPLRYSQGFNPHPLLSFASALSVGYTSDAEWLDAKFDGGIPVETFMQRVNSALPDGLRIMRAREIEEGMSTLTALMQMASYRVCLQPDTNCTASQLQAGIDTLLGGPIMVEKRTKGGMKTVDLRPMVVSMEMLDSSEAAAVLCVEGVLNASGGLNMELLMQAYLRICGVIGGYHIHRTAIKLDGIEG